MRAFAPAQFTITRFDVWRWVIGLLGALVLLVAVAWLVLAELPPAPAMVWPVAAGGLAFTGWLVAVQLRPAPLSLRWDTQRWHLGPAASVGHEPSVGELRVAIDLGVWMLLRFTPDSSMTNAKPTWVPVQRRGLEPHWHTLRCAVYSPRPDAGVDAAPDV
jgi:hypothetical protein